MDAALLMLRILMGAILLSHGTQKSLGWLQGPGLEKSAAFFASLGHRPGKLMVGLAALCEILSALSLISGFLTPVGAAVAAGTLFVAGMSQIANSRAIWNTLGGGEYPIVLGFVALALGIAGPGRWSLDSSLFEPWPSATGVSVVIVAVAAAIPPSLRSWRHFNQARALKN